MSFDALMLLLLGSVLGLVVIFRTLRILFVLIHDSEHAASEGEVDASLPIVEFHVVRFASEKQFHSLFQVIPWEATGTLLVTDNSFIFNGRKANGRKIHLRFNKNSTRIGYIPQSFIRDGGMSWMVIESENLRCYFAGEGDAVPNLTSATTTEMFEALSNSAVQEIELLKANS